MDINDSPVSNDIIDRYSPQTEIGDGKRQMMVKNPKVRFNLLKVIGKIFSCNYTQTKSPKKSMSDTR
jgi:hypothetical protein